MVRHTRRALLAAGGAALASCARRKGSGYAGFVFVANQQGSNVAVVDLLAFAVVRRIALGGEPSAILAAPARRAVYTLCPEQGLVHEIGAAGNKVRRTARLGGPAPDMRMAPKGDALWVLCRAPHSLVRLPLDTFRPGARIRLPGQADDFDLSSNPNEPDSGVAAFSFRREARIGLAKLSSSTLDATLPAPGEPATVRFRRDGEHLLAGDRAARRIGVWDVRRGRFVVNLPVPIEPAGFCFNEDGGQMFVSGPGMDAVSIVYPYRTEVAETILAGRGPESMAASVNPPYLFVANPPAAAVTVLDIETRKLVAVAGVGADPGQILFTPDGVYALVLNRGSGDLAVMRINSLRTETDGTTRRNNPSPLFALIPVGSRPVSAAVAPA
jgi:DNA-binding beta-propeller fold protein YncE